MNIKHYILAMLTLLGMASCSEKDDTVDEFADWQNKNEQYFQAKYLSEDYDLKLLKYSLRPESSVNATDYVLVEKISEDENAPEATPYLNDSVVVHYVGRLIPSVSYKNGYQFDQSYQAPFHEETAVPHQFCVNGTVSGFATALMGMHVGDHWRVTVPYQLGYGTVVQGSIPAYSTLVFDITLVDFWSNKEGDRY